MSRISQLRMFVAESLVNLVIALTPDSDEGRRLAGVLVGYFVGRAAEVDR